MIDAALTPGTLASGEWMARAIGAVAMIGFAALTVDALLRRGAARPLSYAVALGLTTLWLGCETWWGWGQPVTTFAEAARNLGWLWYMASIAGQRSSDERVGAIGWIYISLFSLNLLTGVTEGLAMLPISFGPLLIPVKMLFVSGALVLSHNLYESARIDERRTLFLPVATMGVMWAYDLNLYAITYLSQTPAALLEIVRPAAALLLVILLAMAALRPAAQAVRLSRPVTFRSLALAAVAGWLTLLALVAGLAGWLGSDFGWRAQIGVLALGVASGALLFVSRRARATARVWIAKHFFEHRYDYRSEWLRFTSTLNRSDAVNSAPLELRVISAIADIIEAESGLLLVMNSDGSLVRGASTLPADIAVPVQLDADLLGHAMVDTVRILQLDQVRAGDASTDEMAAVPGWMIAADALWVGVPLIHEERLEAMVLLTRPLVNRALDWEDFDLLRVAGRQAASYLAEARGSAALTESLRFEEFHRRFAFIMHDVKNLASQMSLLARNIDRHGDNPDFRTDMIATVKLSADRLGALIQRLSQQDRVRPARLMMVDMAAVVARVVRAKGPSHPVTVDCDDGPHLALADAEQAEQLIAHVVQNAIEAGASDAPVTLRLRAHGSTVTLDIVDGGAGMSAEFIRDHLFRPFASTKDGGFGIGAYQARQLAEAMGGALTVTSREGAGSVFTLALAIAPSGNRAGADAAGDCALGSPLNQSEDKAA